MELKSVFQKKKCMDTDCPEREDCCTTVRWKISESDYNSNTFKEWWLLHENARIYEERGTYYIQWPMRCKNVSEDGLQCLDYENRPDNCKLYVCHRMADDTVEESRE